MSHTTVSQESPHRHQFFLSPKSFWSASFDHYRSVLTNISRCGFPLLFCSTIVGQEGAHLALDLSFIGTDPFHRRRGAASLLLQWGLKHCTRDNAPAYLESTLDAGRLYERHGFKAAGTLSMVLDGAVDDDNASIVYEETCFVFRPRDMFRTAES